MVMIQNQDIHINMQDQTDSSIFEMSTVDIETDEFQVNAQNKLSIGIDNRATGQIDLPIVNSSCEDILSEEDVSSEEDILSEINDPNLSPKFNKLESLHSQNPTLMARGGNEELLKMGEEEINLAQSVIKRAEQAPNKLTFSEVRFKAMEHFHKICNFI